MTGAQPAPLGPSARPDPEPTSRPVGAPNRPLAARDARPASVPGGTISHSDPYYVFRSADDVVVNCATDRGQTLVIKGPRQMGKSSLLLHYLSECQKAGKKVAFVDFQVFSHEDLAGYPTFLSRFAAWWEHQPGTRNQRLLEFFRTPLFATRDSPVVIFVDEIDATLKLPYTDDFFTAIRTMYNQRGSEPAYEKIAFCLIGVAAPNELVKDRRTTTYNVGKTFEVRDFDLQRDDLAALAAPLADDPQLAQTLLQHVLD